MCAFKLKNPGLPAELWDAFDADDDSDWPIEDEHPAIFNCPGYMYARKQFQDLFQSNITIVSQFLNQPHCNRLAKLLTWIRACRMDKAYLMGLCQALNRRKINQSMNQFSCGSCESADFGA